jgi:succinate dehydrogenase flavin-adding protein (antitoxin of CptAB toxin-antitoxin module)
MTSNEKANLGQLLEQQDPDLLDWFLEKRIPEDSSIANAVRHVLTFNSERDRKNGA